MADSIDENEIINYIRIQMNQLHIKLAQLEQRPHIKKLQGQPFNSSEKPVLSVGTQTPNLAWPDSSGQSANAKDHRGNQIADHIDSIVGLRETVTESHSALKSVWAIALLVGVGATIYFVYAAASEFFDNPTATKVEMKELEEYEYPPFLLCNDAWLDVDKALSLGLSRDAIKYSLGYTGLNVDLENATSARELFFQIYDARKFFSLEEYFMKIAIDVGTEKEISKYISTVFNGNSTSRCRDCIDYNLPRQKIFKSGNICYLFQNAPVNGGKSRDPEGVYSTGIALHDRMQGLIPSSPIWWMYLTSDSDLKLKYVTKSVLSFPSYFLITVRITAQRFISLKAGTTKCVDQNDVALNYSAEICHAKCLNGLFSQTFGCQLFSATFSDDVQIRLTEYCNFNDNQQSLGVWTNFERNAVQIENVTKSILEMNCVKNCSTKCYRTVYDAVLRRQIDARDLHGDGRKAMAMARILNISALELNIEHGATFDGGILTLTEVSTLSFTSMVSNLGGALGLFVGGTMMTIVQVILFIVKYFMNRSSNFNN